MTDSYLRRTRNISAARRTGANRSAWRSPHIEQARQRCSPTPILAFLSHLSLFSSCCQARPPDFTARIGFRPLLFGYFGPRSQPSLISQFVTLPPIDSPINRRPFRALPRLPHLHFIALRPVPLIPSQFLRASRRFQTPEGSEVVSYERYTVSTIAGVSALGPYATSPDASPFGMHLQLKLSSDSEAPPRDRDHYQDASTFNSTCYRRRCLQ